MVKAIVGANCCLLYTSGLTVMGYDAYYTALEALKAAGSTDPSAVNEALWNVDYTGVTGHIT